MTHSADNPPVDWAEQLANQLTFHWENQLRPRLDGLTDDEYLWEPVPGWSVRRRGTATTPMAAGSGDFVIDFELPAPDPAPVTSIAWRLGHVIVDVLALRNHNHFGGPPADSSGWQYAGTAGGALAQLDAAYAHWIEAVKGLSDADLARPVGETEGPGADLPMATLVLHVNREVIHHGAEISLLRDLYAHRQDG